MNLLLMLLMAGGWERSVQVDPMWDFPEETFRLQADGAAVILTMHHAGPTFAIRTEHHLDDQQTEVTYRFGNNAPYQETWLVSRDSKAVLVPATRTRFFLNRLLTESRLIFRVAPQHQEPITVIFETKDLDKQLTAKTTSDAWRQFLASVRLQEQQLNDQAARRNQRLQAAESWLKSALRLQPADLSFKGVQAKSVQDPAQTWGWREKHITRFADGAVKSLRLTAAGGFVSPAFFGDWLTASSLGTTSVSLSRDGTHVYPESLAGISKLTYQVGTKHGTASVLEVVIDYHATAFKTLADWPFALSHILGQPPSKAQFYTAFDQNGRLENPMGWQTGQLQFDGGNLKSLEFQAGDDALPELAEVVRWLKTGGIAMETKDFMQLGDSYRAQDQRLPDGLSAIRLKQLGGRISGVLIESNM